MTHDARRGQFVRPELRAKSVVDLTPAALQALGITALLVDLDNTLKPHYSAEVLPEVRAWLTTLASAGIRVCIVSNALPRRIGELAEQLGVVCVAGARKPWPAAIRRAAQEFGVSLDQVAMVGDQLFTDVWAGNWAGLRTIVTVPIAQAEPWYVSIKRPLEKLIFRCMRVATLEERLQSRV